MTLEQRLRATGLARHLAEDKRRQTVLNLHALVREAADEGMNKTAIARHTGISRQAVHDILRREAA